MEAKIKEKSTNATGEDDLLEGEGSGDDTTTLATGLQNLQGGITELFRPSFSKTWVLVGFYTKPRFKLFVINF